MAVAKSALKEGAKGLIVGVERYYLHVEPRHLHGRRVTVDSLIKPPRRRLIHIRWSSDGRNRA